MTNDVVTALQSFLKAFSDKGLTKPVGEMCQRLLHRSKQRVNASRR